MASKPLTQPQIDAMVASKLNCTGCGGSFPLQLTVDALAAEVTRLREALESERQRLRVNESALMHAKNTASRERCELVETRAALARAVELLRCITETPTPIPNVTTGEYHDLVAAFLAEMEAKR